MALRAGVRRAGSSRDYFIVQAASFSSSWRPMENGTLPLIDPEKQKCKMLQVKLCQKSRVSFFFFVNEKISLLQLPRPFWWSTRRWVTSPFYSLHSATEEPPLTTPLLGGLASTRDVWTAALRADSSSHVMERTDAKGSGHLSVHPLYGEGSPAVSGPASCPVQCLPSADMLLLLQASQRWRPCSSSSHFHAIPTAAHLAHYHLKSLAEQLIPIL